MKRIKISLAVVALILGTGAAFATSTSTKVSTSCASSTPDQFDETLGRIECPGDGQVCCTIGLTTYYKN